MRKRTKFLVIAMTVCTMFLVTGITFVKISNAATIECTWGFSVEDQDGMTFFRVFDQNNNVVKDNVPADARSVQYVTTDTMGSCRVDAVLVYEDRELLSDVGNSAVWAEKPPVDPVVPKTYSITATVTLVE